MYVQKNVIIYGHILGYINIFWEYTGFHWTLKSEKRFAIKSKRTRFEVEVESTEEPLEQVEGANEDP